MLQTYVILSHLCLDPVTGTLNVLDGELDLIRGRDVLPSVEEGLLFHIS